MIMRFFYSHWLGFFETTWTADIARRIDSIACSELADKLAILNGGTRPLVLWLPWIISLPPMMVNELSEVDSTELKDRNEQ